MNSTVCLHNHQVSLGCICEHSAVGEKGCCDGEASPAENRNAAGPYANVSFNAASMDATPQSTQIIQSLRPGDLVGYRQRPECQYEVLMVDEQRLLVVRWPEAVLRFIALRDVVVPF
ncbi:MAG: hypothetical protein AAF722_06205 [Cyanobacteria bacterium P01_C01_bin.70]